MCHVTWATFPSESGRRCRTSSRAVSLTAEDLNVSLELVDPCILYIAVHKMQWKFLLGEHSEHHCSLVFCGII